MFRVVLGLVLLNGIWFIWSHRFLPLTDYPDWLYEGYLLSRMMRGHPMPHFALKAYPVPNAWATVLLGGLDLAISPESAGKLVLTVVVVLFALSSIYLLKSLHASERSAFIYVPLLFVFNTFLFAGELSYLWGLIFFFGYCGYLIRRRKDLNSISGWFYFGTSLVTFLAHLLPYMMAIGVTAIFALGERNPRFVRKVTVAFAPTIAMTIWYAAARFNTEHLAATSLWVPWTVHMIAGSSLGSFSPFPEFLPWLGIDRPIMSAAAVLDLLTAITIVGIWTMCALVWIRGQRRDEIVLVAAAALAAGFLAGGSGSAGLVNPGERFLYPATWLALCWLGGAWQTGPFPRGAHLARAALCALLVAQAIFLDLYAGAAARGLEDLYAQLRAAPSRQAFCSTYEDYRRRSYGTSGRRGLDRFLPDHGTSARLPYYMYIEDRAVAPIFTSGIFKYDGPGDNEDLCK
jgi:hypothetical protein